MQDETKLKLYKFGANTFFAASIISLIYMALMLPFITDDTVHANFLYQAFDTALFIFNSWYLWRLYIKKGGDKK